MQAKVKAACVHVFTASGAVCALFAVQATLARSTEIAFLWLGLAFFIDGIDGYFARRFNVKGVLPWASGETLDLCVDYVTYVFVPVLMLQMGPLQGAWGMAAAAVICMTSLYHFADTESKTRDNCFVGFPAVWNIVAFYIFALTPPLWVSYALIVACAGLTFVRLKWVHPLRVVELRGVTLGLTGLWAAAAAAILWSGFPAGWISGGAIVLVAAYVVGLSLHFGRVR